MYNPLSQVKHLLGSPSQVLQGDWQLTHLPFCSTLVSSVLHSLMHSPTLSSRMKPEVQLEQKSVVPLHVLHFPVQVRQTGRSTKVSIVSFAGHVLTQLLSSLFKIGARELDLQVKQKSNSPAQVSQFELHF